MNPFTGPWRDNNWAAWGGGGPDWQHVRLVARARYDDQCLTDSAAGGVRLQACNGEGNQD